MRIRTTKLYLYFKNSVSNSCFLCTLVGCLLLGSMPALGFVISAIFGIIEKDIIFAIFVSAMGGGAGGMAVYFTRSLTKRGNWGIYLSLIIIIEAYITVITLCIFVVVFLFPYLRDEDFDEMFYSFFFHLALHIYSIFLVTFSVGVVSLQKFIRKRRAGSRNITKFPKHLP